MGTVPILVRPGPAARIGDGSFSGPLWSGAGGPMVRWPVLGTVPILVHPGPVARALSVQGSRCPPVRTVPPRTMSADGWTGIGTVPILGRCPPDSGRLDWNRNRPHSGPVSPDSGRLDRNRNRPHSGPALTNVGGGSAVAGQRPVDHVDGRRGEHLLRVATGRPGDEEASSPGGSQSSTAPITAAGMAYQPSWLRTRVPQVRPR